MSEVYSLEQQLVDVKKLAERRKLALKLADNHEFRKLILEDFCLTECARYAQVSGDMAVGAAERADAMAMAQAAGHLKRFLSVVVQMGFNAEHEIPNIEQAIEEARQEEGE